MNSSPRVDAELRTRTRHQEVLADLGQQALEGDDLDQLVYDASAAVAETKNAAHVVATEDEGIGIDADETDRIFDIFQRLHGHATHAGIGIAALCERIVERNGGRRVESELGEGSASFFTPPKAGEGR